MSETCRKLIIVESLLSTDIPWHSFGACLGIDRTGRIPGKPQSGPYGVQAAGCRSRVTVVAWVRVDPVGEVAVPVTVTV